jgi:hypothetical protein
MSCYSLLHLADHVLLRDLATLNSQDRATTAALLAHLAEVDERKLYLPAAYPSMFLYCTRELRMSEDVALKRIGVARVARQFPAIVPALADGRPSLSTVLLLAPKRAADEADELLAAAANKTRAEIELLLAQRFLQPDVPTLVQGVAGAGGELAPPVDTPALELAPGRVDPAVLEIAPGRVGAPALELAPERVVLRRHGRSSPRCPPAAMPCR